MKVYLQMFFYSILMPCVILLYSPVTHSMEEEVSAGYDFSLMSRENLLLLPENPSLDSLNHIREGKLALFVEGGKLYCKISGKDKMEIPVNNGSAQATNKGLPQGVYEEIKLSLTDKIINPEAFQFAANMGNTPVSAKHYNDAFKSIGNHELSTVFDFISSCGYVPNKARNLDSILMQSHTRQDNYLKVKRHENDVIIEYSKDNRCTNTFNGPIIAFNKNYVINFTLIKEGNLLELHSVNDEKLSGVNPITLETDFNVRFNNAFRKPNNILMKIIAKDIIPNNVDLRDESFSCTWGGLANQIKEIKTKISREGEFLDNGQALFDDIKAKGFKERECETLVSLISARRKAADQGKSINRSLLKEILNNHVGNNPKLLNSSIDKDVVIFLGKTGAGKSTLINYLSGKCLVNNKGDIVLSNNLDPSAMKIGTSARSETILPKYVEVNNLIIYDLPGFGDTRGTSISLVNACFIKRIIEGARTARLIFIVGFDEITSGRGAHIRELCNAANNLLPNSIIEECSSLIVTKSPFNFSEMRLFNKEELIEILQEKTDPGILDRWVNGQRLTKMSIPGPKILGPEINQEDRNDILKTIQRATPKKIQSVNIQAIYTHSDLDHLKEAYSEEIHENFIKLKESILAGRDLCSLDIKDLTKINEEFQADAFFKNLEAMLQQSTLITLLSPISDHIYTKTWNSSQRNLSSEMIKIQHTIEEEITKRKMNFLVSPQGFATTLHRIYDISDLLKKSQVPLAHKKAWATEVLNEICIRNYTSIRLWLDGILSVSVQDYSMLSDSKRVYQIPEVFGKDGGWVCYNSPILYKLEFQKEEDAKCGSNGIKFIKYNLLSEKKPHIQWVTFKFTQYTEEIKRKLESDRNYQDLLKKKREQDQELRDRDRQYKQEYNNKTKNKSDDIKGAEEARKNRLKWNDENCTKLKKKEWKEWNSTTGKFENKEEMITERDNDMWQMENDKTTKAYSSDVEEIRSSYDNDIYDLKKDFENDKAEIRAKIKNFDLEIQRYENEVYPKTTRIHPKDKQINDIIEQIIIPNFNAKSFIGCIEFENSEIEATTSCSPSLRFSNARQEDGIESKKRGLPTDFTANDPRSKKSRGGEDKK